MIRINAQSDSVLIKPVDKSAMPDAVRLFNSGSDIRYATGLDRKISIPELGFLLDNADNADNSFMAGIYIKMPDCDGSYGRPRLQFAGICSGMLSGYAVWIKLLSITAAYRRRGIGSSAASLVMEYMKGRHGASEVFISVLQENTAGLAFWKRLGFMEVINFKKELFAEKKTHNVIIMQKQL